jgi:hypothetical protein
VKFGKLVDSANRQNISMAAHCTASFGRTGLMMMFVVMISKQIFDPIKLLIATAKMYKRQAVDELLELIQDKDEPHKLNDIMSRFFLAYEQLLHSVKASRNSLIVSKKTLIQFEKEKLKIILKMKNPDEKFPDYQEMKIKKVLDKLPTDQKAIQPK